MSKEKILMKSLTEFYSKGDNMKKFLDIVGYSNEDDNETTSKVSRRILDWFVTSYSKRHNIIYDLSDPKLNEKGNSGNILISRGSSWGTGSDEVIPFNVNRDYRAQLKSFQKKYFDPFRRRDRIKFYYDTNKYKRTTVGQLNFFRWALSNKIIEYILLNLEDIEYDMNNYNKLKDHPENSKKSKAIIKNKETNSTITATRTCTKHYTKITISFD